MAAAAAAIQLKWIQSKVPPECQICHSHLTVKHNLMDCTCFGAALRIYLGVDTRKELFGNIESRNIVAFIKDRPHKLLLLYRL